MADKKLCIIPARGGSKRIPKKNIKLFLGEPIITYSIKTAISSGLFEEIMISTDDAETADIGIKMGIKVPFMRSKRNSDDYSTTFDVISEVLNNYKDKGKEFKYVCCLYPCAPLVTVDDLNSSFNKLEKNNYDSLLPIIKIGSPIERSIILDSDKIKWLQKQYSNSRSQDLRELYNDAGQYYWLNTEKCFDKGDVLTENSGFLIIPAIKGQDIDNEDDWEVAEFKYLFNKKTDAFKK